MIATGALVTWHELPLGRRFTRRIVPASRFRELAAENSRTTHEQLMPETAPIARAVMGALPGDVVTVETGFGPKTITVEGVGR